MKNNIIELPAGRIRRNTLIQQRKRSKDPDLYVDMVESDPGHIARRQARREAHYAAAAQEREEADSLTQTLAMTTLFSLLGGTLATALALVF